MRSSWTASAGTARLLRPVLAAGARSISTSERCSDQHFAEQPRISSCERNPVTVIDEIDLDQTVIDCDNDVAAACFDTHARSPFRSAPLTGADAPTGHRLHDDGGSGSRVRSTSEASLPLTPSVVVLGRGVDR